MKTELLLVRDGLEGAAPWMAQVLRDAGFKVRTTSAGELGETAPAEVVLLRIGDRNPTAACWTLHRQGYRWIVAVRGRRAARSASGCSTPAPITTSMPGCRRRSWSRG